MWQDTFSEYSTDKSYYMNMPSGVSNPDRVELYFNETPYGTRYDTSITTSPVSQNTVILKSGGYVNIQGF